MNKLTRDEFIDRTRAVLRAKNIFIDSGVTNNISVAFELYQKILADREREIELNTIAAGSRNRTIMDKYERPLCPVCNNPMRFRRVPENTEGIKIQLICENPKCDTVLDSDKDIQWWMSILGEKEEIVQKLPIGKVLILESENKEVTIIT